LKDETVGLKNFADFYGKGEVVYADPDFGAGLWSKKFQWLPCETQFLDDSSTNVQITSYINNLHPIENAGVYPIVEKFISLSIPLWNQILNGRQGDIGYADLRIHTTEADFDTQLPRWAGYYRPGDGPTQAELINLVEDYLKIPDNPNHVQGQSDEEEVLPENWREEWGPRLTAEWKWKRMRSILHPEPGPEKYESWKEKTQPPVKLETRFREDGLQIIVKLASIELTPDKPDYAGGNWHLEGMSNEHIRATSIYYYDVENVTDARISFRAEALLREDELSYAQDEHEPLQVVFGAPDLRDGPAAQDIGSISTKDGRILAFPNTLQHKVEPFSLRDKTKPGHRRFLVLWLVDPHFKIMSTANIAPLRRDWWAAEVMRKAQWNLPTELAEMVIEDASKGWLMGLKEAKHVRLELMDERVVFVESVESNFDTYGLCEH
jgi:hypothetical protein